MNTTNSRQSCECACVCVCGSTAIRDTEHRLHVAFELMVYFLLLFNFILLVSTMDGRDTCNLQPNTCIQTKRVALLVTRSLMKIISTANAGVYRLCSSRNESTLLATLTACSFRRNCFMPIFAINWTVAVTVMPINLHCQIEGSPYD